MSARYRFLRLALAQVGVLEMIPLSPIDGSISIHAKGAILEPR